MPVPHVAEASSTAPLTAEEVLEAERRALREAHDRRPFTALCLSGGGIRSATFGLGVLQALAERGHLERLDYLSTVSGGGYIGSWLTAWAARAGGLDAVSAALAPAAHAPGSGRAEAPAVAHLRAYNNYLSPRSGLFSTDVWTLTATILRNVILNWMVLIPLLLAGLMAPRFYLSLLAFPERFYRTVVYAGGAPDYSVPALDAVSGSFFVRLALPLASAGLFATALVHSLRYLPGVGGRPHTRAHFAARVLAPLVGAVLSFLLFDSLYFLGSRYEDYSNLWTVVAWTSIPCVAAWLLFAAVGRRPLGDRLRLVRGPLSAAIAAMAAATGASAWAITNFLLWSPNPDAAPSWAEYVTIGPPLVLLGYGLGSTLFAGLASSILSDDDREWLARSTAEVLLVAVIWAGACGAVLLLPGVVVAWRAWGYGSLLAALLACAVLVRSGGSPAANANPGATVPRRTSALESVATVAPVLFILLLATGLSLVTNVCVVAAHRITGLALAAPGGEGVFWHDHANVLAMANIGLVAAVMLLFAASTWLMGRLINVNVFSLHGMYRDRLVRAYLGASNRGRHPSAFTGFDRADDLPLASLAATRPLHVLNLTLNLVETSRLDWQQRRAAPFTATPLHCGSATLGYRDTARYAGGLSLGTAAAVSGAAASPNMGYYSSPLLGVIMTLFNARLGAWFGNPGPAGATTWTDAGPRSALRWIAKELLGATSDDTEYVYLSDGGHFENLGLYEMVRRRCGLILAVDASCDGTFACGDLGNALRKVRIDFGVPIDFDDGAMRAVTHRERRWAEAVIRYSARDPGAADGRLIVVKPMLLGTEPPDVTSYAAAHPAFPHQSTAQQWFDESQTESYRQLGLQTMREVIRHWPADWPGDWARAAERTVTAR